jgi:hypothetical protein
VAERRQEYLLAENLLPASNYHGSKLIPQSVKFRVYLARKEQRVTILIVYGEQFPGKLNRVSKDASGRPPDSS